MEIRSIFYISNNAYRLNNCIPSSSLREPIGKTYWNILFLLDLHNWLHWLDTLLDHKWWRLKFRVKSSFWSDWWIFELVFLCRNVLCSDWWLWNELRPCSDLWNSFQYNSGLKLWKRFIDCWLWDLNWVRRWNLWPWCQSCGRFRSNKLNAVVKQLMGKLSHWRRFQ